jgi:lipopolysaccharide export system protein LptA
MGKGVGGDGAGRILKIHSSGVRFESDTGKASTNRPATFEYDQGGGSAEGVDYDPQTRELHLRSHVSMDWRGKEGSKPMHIEAGEAYYREGKSEVALQPWSKLTRDTLHMEGGASLVTLDKGVIKQADSQAARGVQDDPGRKVEFSADHLLMQFGEGMIVKSILGDHNGKLVSTANATRTTVTGDRLDLAFDPAAKESTLLSAVATGKGMAQAEPVSQPGVLAQETRILHSELIRLAMRQGGRDIDKVIADGPGTVDFLPNRMGQAKRHVTGDHMEFIYGAENRLQHFGAVNATTRTEHPEQPAAPPVLTRSKEIAANFDPKTGDLALLAQKTDFHYQEGARQATANLATLDPGTDLMTLDGSARAWDPTGSAAADRLVMNQKTGDFTADGHVATTRVPDSDNSSNSAMLSNAEVMQGRAQHMTSAERNQKLHYEGNAVVWQGANRVEADRIDIERAAQIFEAHGKVVSQFIDKSKDDKSKDDNSKDKDKTPVAAKKTGAPIFTVVRATDLHYSGETRIALYQGGAAMVRPGLTVTSQELKAYLNDSDADSSLDKAFADGTAKIVSNADKRTRTGTSEHAEYYTTDQKVILDKGEPLLVDSLKGKTQGKQLTWWANNDRLLVNGVEDRHVDSLLRKK